MTAQTIWLTEHTWVIAHQTFLVWMHCNTYWLHCDKFLHAIYGYWVFFFIIAVAYPFFPGRVLAVFFATDVERRVILFLDESMIFGVLIGIKHPSSSASEVDWITVDQILDRESLWRFVQLNSVSSFHCGSCGEGPARSATPLITWKGQFALLVPVDWLRELWLS